MKKILEEYFGRNYTSILKISKNFISFKKIYITNYKIHTDDTLNTIKIKIVNSIRKLSIETNQEYLYLCQNDVLNLNINNNNKIYTPLNHDWKYDEKTSISLDPISFIIYFKNDLKLNIKNYFLKLLFEKVFTKI